MLPAEDDAWEPDPLDAPLQSEPSPADLARKSLTHDLMQADVDNMTPKAAMELLYKFRERLPASNRSKNPNNLMTSRIRAIRQI